MSFSSLSASTSSFLSSGTQTTQTPSSSSSRSRRKVVAFADVEIIEHPMTVGDAPTIGVPLTLDWEAQERNTFPLEFFEQFRPQRKNKDSLRITPQSRERVYVVVVDVCQSLSSTNSLSYSSPFLILFPHSFPVFSSYRLLKNGCTVDEIQKGSQRASKLRKDRIHTVRGLQVLQQIEQTGTSSSEDTTYYSPSTSRRNDKIPDPPSVVGTP